MRLTWSYHVGLQEGTLQVDVVVIESLVDSGQHCLCHLLASLKTVVSITENFRLNYRHESGCLTRGSVSEIKQFLCLSKYCLEWYLAKTLAFSMIAW